MPEQQQIIVTDIVELVYMQAFDYMQSKGFMQVARVIDVSEWAADASECDCCGHQAQVHTEITYLDVDSKQQYYDYVGPLIELLAEMF